MESTFLCCSSTLPFRPFSSGSRRRLCTVAARRSEAHDQHYYNRRLVDENMIVLRKRIHEMKVVERNYEPPEDWMEWEKQYFAGYDSLICEMVGLLQSQLMNTRPSLALGIIGLIIFSVPLSMATVLFHFLEITRMILEPFS
ncbi:hypothetical protein K2173_012754 [Erythroxylum novogranatense]|uniref:Uncharacterized protein n=1 Tax=Erythroxylum novogranatense TaxID=1862640 RepID=A0AAV8TW50_9ROSI|nr:hypothetical protein K2173_012754 [Erythroxylum novogranatense]